jgi:hypothetical protein
MIQEREYQQVQDYKSNRSKVDTCRSVTQMLTNKRKTLQRVNSLYLTRDSSNQKFSDRSQVD